MTSTAAGTRKIPHQITEATDQASRPVARVFATRSPTSTAMIGAVSHHVPVQAIAEHDGQDREDEQDDQQLEELGPGEVPRAARAPRSDRAGPRRLRNRRPERVAQARGAVRVEPDHQAQHAVGRVGRGALEVERLGVLVDERGLDRVGERLGAARASPRPSRAAPPARTRR